jgi:hypothetical protein
MNRIDRGLARCGAALAVSLLAAAPGIEHASQTSGSDQANPSSSSATAASGNQSAVEYDPIIAKRAHLRLQYDKSPHASTACTFSLHVDHSRLVDFVNILPKRSDLRMRASMVGLEQAYAEWSHQTAK